MITLRDFQQEGQNEIFRHLHNGQSKQLVVMATGLGKTVLGSSTTTNFRRALWLTHREELIDQSALALLATRFGFDNHGRIEEEDGYRTFLNKFSGAGMFGGEDSKLAKELLSEVGIVKAERLDLRSRIVVASVQTMMNRLNYFKGNEFDCIIVDEAHLALAKSWVKVINHFKPDLLLGLTATPTRLDGMSLDQMFGKITFERNIDWGINNGYLVEIEAIQMQTNISLDGVHTRGGEFIVNELQDRINIPARNAMICEKYLEYMNGENMIFYAVDVKHAMDMHDMCRKMGIRSTFVVGDKSLCPNRADRIKGYKDGTYEWLINVDIATTGFDHDMVLNIGNGRPTKSLTLFLQCLGRGTRPEKGVINGLKTAAERIAAIQASRKPKLKVLDVVDNTNQHQLVNTWTLDQGKKIEDKLFMTKKQKQDALFKMERERKLKHVLMQDKRVQLSKLPTIKIENKGRYMEEATDAQKAVLQKCGYDTSENYYTKYDASLIIGGLDAQEWMKKQLKGWGYEYQFATYAQYQEVKRRIEKEAEQRKREKISEALKNTPFLDLE